MRPDYPVELLKDSRLPLGPQPLRQIAPHSRSPRPQCARSYAAYRRREQQCVLYQTYPWLDWWLPCLLTRRRCMLPGSNVMRTQHTRDATY